MVSLSFCFSKLIRLPFSIGRENRKALAPLAQLVEQLTLNQWVPGSSPWRCTIYFGSKDLLSTLRTSHRDSLLRKHVLGFRVITNRERFATEFCDAKLRLTVHHSVSDFIAEGPPVPIPNTEVKLCYGEDTCLETSRENSSLLTHILKGKPFEIAYLLKQAANNPRNRISWCFYRRGSTCSHSEHRS